MEYRVGHLKLQPHRQVLDGAEPVPIGRKALDLLSVLAKAEGALVTKDELMAAVWPGVIVEENAIQVHIAALRRALGEAAAQLSTVRGLGYRLSAQALVPAAAAPIAKVSDPPGPLVAVLCFENRSSDPDLEYFADGVSEEILQAIARIDGVRVIARTSSFQLSGPQRSTSAVAVALGASHILDGSVRRQAERLRIAAQLVEVASETVLWSERFDGAIADVFAVQDLIARSVAGALKLKFAVPARRVPIDPRAYDLYLHGRRLAGPPDTRRECIERYEAAVAIAPDFAEAWASLALARALAARWDERVAPYAEQSGKARDAAARALSLDPKAATAHVALGVLVPFASYSLHESFLETALAAGPNDAETLRQISEFAFSVGRFREAFNYVERVWRLDPLNPLTAQNYANLLNEQGWHAESVATYALLRERWPHISWFHSEPVLIAAFAGDWRLVDELLAEKGADRPEMALARGAAHALRNPDADTRRAALAYAEADFTRLGRVDISTLIFIYALGLHDETFDYLERSDYSHLFAIDGKGHDSRGFLPGLVFCRSNRDMVRDARFTRLCEKLGLGTYWRETGRWPDCADEVPYDLRSAILRNAGKAGRG